MGMCVDIRVPRQQPSPALGSSPAGTPHPGPRAAPAPKVHGLSLQVWGLEQHQAGERDVKVVGNGWWGDWRPAEAKVGCS